MQPDTWLVEDVERPHKRGTKRRGEVDSLTLTARESGRKAIERKIFKPDFLHNGQAVSDLNKQTLGHSRIMIRKLEFVEPYRQL